LLSEKYITANCTIGKGIVNKNGIKAFENSNADTPGFLLSIYQHFRLNYPKFYKMDNLSKLGWLASEILLKDDFKAHLYQPEQVGIVLANANSSLDDDIKYYASVSDIPSPSLFVYTLPNIMIGEICIRNNFKGEHALFVQEKFDADFIKTQVNYLLNSDLLQACICGWVDVLEEDYKAVLFLVEKEKGEQALPFSKDNMNSIFINN
jgi:ribosomal protein L30E